ncbi:MAG: hypothetical protein KDI69_07160 [Xanthomonadales bacterium]|nr:hypothetical protein [Xanthomonadales bacterium]
MVGALRAGLREPRASYLAVAALREAMYGNAPEARQRARAALEWLPSRDVQFGAAMAFAYAGDTEQAEALSHTLASQNPDDTLVQSNYLPVLRAKLMLDRGNSQEALTLLHEALPYELGASRSSLLAWTSLYPIYVRGQAYWANQQPKEALAEFDKILEHPGLSFNYPIGPMAQLQRAEILAQSVRTEGAALVFTTLREQWQDADPDFPVLRELAGFDAP